jgi:hypothetical protein
MKFAISIILFLGFSGNLIGQGSGLVQPLSNPLPDPSVQAKAPSAQGAPVSSPPQVGAPAVAPSSAASPPATGVAQPLAPGSANPQGPSSTSLVAPLNSQISPTQNELPSSNPLVSPIGPDQNIDSDKVKWIAEVLPKAEVLPRRIAFVTELPTKGVPQFLTLDAARFNQQGYFQTVDAASISWDLKLNKKSFESRDSFAVALALTKADAIVFAPKKGEWTIHSAIGGRNSIIVRGPAPPGTKEENLIAWLTSILGWDGVVLGRKDQQLIVGSTKAILSQPQLQALAVDGSVSKLALSQTERVGSGLLSLTYSKDGIGIFDIVFLGKGVKDIPIGTKLIIEKK